MKKNVLRTFKVICFLILFLNSKFFSVQAQKINAEGALAEKIYIQLDRNLYSREDIIWFKAIVTNSLDHSRTALSRVLYVELISEDQRILQTKILKLNFGIGSGFFELNKEYDEGNYLIRAYTEWNKNFGEDFFFQEYIQVVDILDTAKQQVIRDTYLISDENNQQHLFATIDPLQLDSLHKKVPEVFLVSKNRKVSIPVKKNKNNMYRIDHILSEEDDIVTLNLETKNKLKFSKKILVNQDNLDLQFFPESGKLVAGIASKVGFKSLDIYGKGKQIKGRVIDDKGALITLFQSNPLGMGTLFIKNPKEGRTYYAKLKSHDTLFPLPKVVLQGTTFSLSDRKDNLYLKIQSNSLKNDSISMKVQCRGALYENLKEELKDGKLGILFPKNKIPEGVISFTIYNAQNIPIAERLYFNKREESSLKIEIATDQKVYEKRDKVVVTLSSIDIQKNLSKINASLLVLDKNQVGEMQHMRQNIYSYFLLNSDLKGVVENPNFYFKEGENTSRDLDILMLTQGWSNYKYKKPLTNHKMQFKPEKDLSISGTVERFRKKIRDIDVTLMVFDKKGTIQSNKTDSLGAFKFNLPEIYKGVIKVAIGVSKNQKPKRSYKVVFDERKVPDINFETIVTDKRITTMDSIFIKAKRKIQKEVEAFEISNGILELDEVVVKGYKMTPLRKKNSEEFGFPDTVIDRKELLKKEKEWHLGVFDVIRSSYPKEVKIREIGPTGNSFLYPFVLGADLTIVMVDDQVVPLGINYFPYYPSLLNRIKAKDVKSVEILNRSPNADRLFSLAFPESQGLPPPIVGLVIIYTHSGKGLEGATESISVSSREVSTYSAKREFYVPRYGRFDEENSLKPDFRSTVYWKPEIVIDKNSGEAKVSFYNGDNIGTMKVIIEAISEEGKVTYKEIEYTVE